MKELKKNEGYLETALGFSEPWPEKIGSEEVKTGIQILENGDIRFRVYAPNATYVDADFDIDCGPSVALNKRDDGVFEGILPYDPTLKGMQICNFYVDNTLCIVPNAPISYCKNRAVNICDIPDKAVDYIEIKDVPHGSVTRELFYSKALSRWERCFVYLPPDYSENETYPVLYLQHGFSGNETVWLYEGRIANIMDNLLSEKKCKPFLVVMNNGMVRYPFEVEGKNEFTAFTKMLIEDCIPFIEKRFHARGDKWGRAMAGLSMGSTQTSHIAMEHPELFGYFGLFSGCMRGMVSDEHYENYDFLAITKDRQRFADSYRLFFRAIGDMDATFQNFLRDDRYLTSCGITELPCHCRKVYAGQRHEWGAWRRAVYDFAQMLF